MTNIYELNRNVFATTSKVVKPSRRARKAMTQPLDEIIGIEMSYEDCCEVNGGVEILRLDSVTCYALSTAITVGGAIKGVIEHSKFFSKMPLTTIALVAAFSYLGGAFMDQLSKGSLSLHIDMWSLIGMGVFSIIVGGALGWMTGSAHVLLDSTLAVNRLSSIMHQNRRLNTISVIRNTICLYPVLHFLGYLIRALIYKTPVRLNKQECDLFLIELYIVIILYCIFTIINFFLKRKNNSL